jgi:hypothetical protein
MEYSRSEQLLSEWIPFVQAARRSSEQNVEISLDHCNGRRSLFYKVIRSVTPNSELFAWYSDQLAEELGLPVVRDDCRKGNGHVSACIFICSFAGCLRNCRNKSPELLFSSDFLWLKSLTASGKTTIKECLVTQQLTESGPYKWFSAKKT